MRRITNLSISSWNIAGNKIRMGSSPINKIDLPDFKHYLTDDIMCLLETHTGQNDNMELEGYKSFLINRPKPRKGGRNSGGLALYIRDNIRNQVEWVHTGSPECTWIRLKNADLETGGDLSICFAYANPPNSTYSSDQDALTKVYGDLCRFSQQGKCLVMGDLNGYTGTELDYIAHDSYNDRTDGTPLPHYYNEDEPCIKRQNKDTRNINARGQAILDLCIESNLRILNGRKLGDTGGNFTCFSENANSPSVIDYALCDATLFYQVNTFQIEEFTPFSDHCKIKVN